MRSDIQSGARFPDYELLDHDGIARRLSDLQADQPMILVLARCHFCPKDHKIREVADPEHDPMLPHTLVLAPGLIIHSVYCGYWFWGRPSRDDLWRDLRDVLRATQDDFDSTAAAPRALLQEVRS